MIVFTEPPHSFECAPVYATGETGALLGGYRIPLSKPIRLSAILNVEAGVRRSSQRSPIRATVAPVSALAISVQVVPADELAATTIIIATTAAPVFNMTSI